MEVASLPPKVYGIVYGYLDVKVDQIVWIRRSQTPVLIHASWWGYDDTQTFRLHSKRDKTQYTYNINTNFNLFQSYLINCDSLTLSVVDEKSRSIIGTCKIENLIKLINCEKPTQNFFPIFNNYNSIIGNVRVSFQLSLIQKNDRTEKKFISTSNIDTHSESIAPCTSLSSLKKYYDELENPSSDDAVNNRIVERVINQGQRLRNAMIETILENDPLNKDVYSNTYQKQSETDLKSKKVPSSSTGSKLGSNCAFDYLLGAEMTSSDEREALEQIKNLSPASSIIKLASDLYFSKAEAPIDQPEKKSAPKIVKSNVAEPKASSESSSSSSHSSCFLSYIDSLKVYVYSLKLNEAGWRKITGVSSSKRGLNPTFFIEYAIPALLKNDILKSKSKIGFGFNSDETIRICSKKFSNEVIYFKSESIHKILNVESINLDSVKIVLKVHSRTINQRGAILLGNASVSIYDAVHDSNLTSDQELILFDNDKPIAIGNIKIRLQVGCDQLHFGRDFMDIVNSEKENKKLSDNDSLTQHLEEECSRIKTLSKKIEKVSKKNIVSNETKTSKKTSVPKKFDLKMKKVQYVPRIVEKADKPVPMLNSQCNTAIETSTNILLQGLIYLPEVFFEHEQNRCTFLVCRAFWREDATSSKICHHTQRAVFNFREIIPILYNNQFLLRTKNNFLIIEIWDSNGSNEKLLGLCKLPLHQFYIAYRDPKITAHLIESKFPVIGFDDWEDFTNPLSGHSYGQVHALLAIGTEAQIQFLETSRGLNESSVTKLVDYPEHSQNLVRLNSKPQDAQYTRKSERNFDLEDSFVAQKSKESETERVIFESKSVQCIPEVEKTQIVNETYTVFDSLVSQKPIAIPENRVIYESKSVQCSPILEEQVTKDKNFDLQANLSKIPSKNLLDNSFQICTYKTSSTQTNMEYQENETKPNDSSSKPNPENIEAIRKYFFDSIFELTSRLPTTSERIDSTSTQTSQELTNQGSQTNDQNKNLPLDTTQNIPRIGETSKLLDVLQQALAMPSQRVVNTIPNVKEDQQNAQIQPKPGLTANTFKAHVVVENGVLLQARKRRSKHKSKNVNRTDFPTTFVTFDPMQDKNILYTSIAHKTLNPKWNQHFECQIPIDLLLDDQKKLLFKVWVKNKENELPNPVSDNVLGFAALDLTVLAAGLSAIHGWFNITDFSGRCKGQLQINITPLENVTSHTSQLFSNISTSSELSESPDLSIEIPQAQKLVSLDPIETFEMDSTSSLLSNTLKRKFTELDEINARLKQRLMDVTKDDDEENYKDEYVHEFEHDLNTPAALEADEDFDFTKLEVSLTLQKNDNSKTDCFNTLVSAASVADSGYIEMKEAAEAGEASKSCFYDKIEAEIKNLTNVDSANSNTDSSSTVSLTELDNRLKQSKLQFDSLFEKLSLHSLMVNANMENQNDQSQNMALDPITENSVEQDSLAKNNDNDPASTYSISSDSADKTYDKVNFPESDTESSSFGVNSETMLLREGPEGAGNASNENLLQNVYSKNL